MRFTKLGERDRRGRPKGRRPGFVMLDGLAAARAASGLTCLRLAVVVGCDPSMISRYERCQVPTSRDQAFKLAQALRVSPEQLSSEIREARESVATAPAEALP